MTYTQKANPNATNSELDAKKVNVIHPLTDLQRTEVISQYAEIVVDRMDTKTLIQIVYDTLVHEYEEMGVVEFRDYVVDMENSGDPTDNLYDELVENVIVSDLMKEAQ